jgi:hypothetical protein
MTPDKKTSACKQRKFKLDFLNWVSDLWPQNFRFLDLGQIISGRDNKRKESDPVQSPWGIGQRWERK